MKIIKQRERVTDIYYTHDFYWKDDPSGGFTFPCDENGVSLQLNPCAVNNYKKCINGEYDVIDQGIIKHTSNYMSAAIGVCSCGCKVELSNFTNTCDRCGKDYGMNGNLLAPRSQWGCETGESWWECY